MAKQTITAHLCMALQYPMGADGIPNYGAERQWLPEIWWFRPSESESRIYVGAQQVTIEVPDDFNPVTQQVAALEKEMAEALKKYQATVEGIKDRLSRLLAITHEA